MLGRLPLNVPAIAFAFSERSNQRACCAPRRSPVEADSDREKSADLVGVRERLYCLSRRRRRRRSPP